MKFALFGNAYQAGKAAAAQTLVNHLASRGAQLSIDREYHNYLTANLGVAIPKCDIIDGDSFEADVALSMGGDGTFLETARRVGDKGIGILGINLGRLGFLADADAADVERVIDEVMEGTYVTDPRCLLQCCVEGNTPLRGYPFALNEVAVLKRDNASMIAISVEVDRLHLATYEADGLIVSTPTGSTGYALSVGGPVISPHSHSVAITAVAPHSLGVRPVMLPDDHEVRLTVTGRTTHFLVSIDGRSEALPDGTTLVLTRAPYAVNILRHPSHNFFYTLRHKLGFKN